MNESTWQMRAVDPQFAWLNQHASGWQFGEAGVLDAIAKRLDIQHAVEIGAGDGCELPLTVDPLYQRGIACTLFEADDDRRRRLAFKYPNATICGRFEDDSVNDLDVPSLVIVDVDGMDWLIAVGIAAVSSPAVLMVEHYDIEAPNGRNQSGDIGKSFPPTWLLGMRLKRGFVIQAPHEAMTEVLSKFHGYTLAAQSRVNSLYVHQSRIEEMKCST
jgi:hypothetical protein